MDLECAKEAYRSSRLRLPEFSGLTIWVLFINQMPHFKIPILMTKLKNRRENGL
jgi:hypothetical protein